MRGRASKTETERPLAASLLAAPTPAAPAPMMAISGSEFMGAIITGYVLGIAEGLTKVFYPEASNIVIFVIMAIVLLIRPAGLFGRDA